MLDSLRNAARTWVAKLLLLLLVVSFGIWGVSSSIIADTSNSVITVGNQSVSASEFRLAYQRRLAELSRQFGTQLTTEQARALGVVNQVYAQLSAGAALDELADEMNLGLSEDRLAQLIADDPAFTGAGGQFDRQVFTARLRNAGLQEDDYILERSNVAIRSQIVEATADGFKAPQVLIDALRAYRNETRDVDYLLLTKANLDPVAPPAEDVLATWFDTVKARYNAPEYRRFAYVKLEPSDIAEPAAITDEQIREDYERRKASYEIPGTRTIEQLTFENRDMANAAAEELSRGTSFDQLVADQGRTATDVLLGDFTRASIPDPALADAAFAVAQNGGTTPVIDGAFGPVILRISNIKPDTTRTFDEVKEEIRNELAQAAAVEDILTVHDRFEDIRGSGATLADAAKELNLQLVEVPLVDNTGRDTSEKDVDLPGGAELLKDVFQTDVGVEALPLNIGRDGYLWFEVADIVPSRERKLEEVREKALADWTAEQQRVALGAKAEALRERLEKGETIADLATELSIAVETKTGLKRSDNDAVLGSAGIAAAFSGPVGTADSAPGADPDTQIVLKVTNVQSGAGGDVLAADDSQVEAIANAAGDDILDQMVNQLQSDYGVRINQTLADQAMVQ
ncbi:peptidylprolyl isomerase [Ciceribacter sp. L1K22]|uniref:peptidylprolyl isomerase n=1 Tax=Ciceribacter sp. L1K22 TaxID=2820275 RepID=UPI001ABE0282|nr:peptidylprolyl isomerase [Ciceribacter sp. L1K22]MBO3760232.1 SurA N-terminal domain-containing protein [Ciceribacter sp. L1K22]